MIWKSKGGWKRCYYDVQIKRGMDKGGHYGGNERVDGKGGIMMCKLKGGMDKGGHYDVEIKGWMEKEAL